MIQFGDTEILVIMMVLLFAFKLFDVNAWKYDMLRTHHSKNYITSNYVGIGEWIFFSKSIKEIGIVLPIVNILAVLTFIAQGGALLLALQKYNVKLYIAVIAIVFAFLSIVAMLMTVRNYTALGIEVKGNRVNYGERIITVIAFSAIMCFLAFLLSRGVLF